MKAKIALGLAIAWGVFGVVGMFIPPVRESVPLIFFMVAYTVAIGHLTEWAAHRAEETNRDD